MEREFSATSVLTKEESPDISMTIIKLKGLNRRVMNTTTTACYVCIEGNVTFVIGEKDRLVIKHLKPGESIKIQSNTPYFDYSDDGVKMIAVNKKAFDPDSVIELPMLEGYTP
jgi:hypothetical protein